jgi:hypothetical protein
VPGADVARCSSITVLMFRLVLKSRDTEPLVVRKTRGIRNAHAAYNDDCD